MRGKKGAIMSLMRPSDAEIVACLEGEYEMRDAKVTHLPIGADADSMVFHVQIWRFLACS